MKTLQRIHTLVLTALSFAPVLGCSALEITDGSGKTLNGVPFYAKKGFLEQTTALSMTWVEVTVTVATEGSDPDDSKSTTFAIGPSRWDTGVAIQWAAQPSTDRLAALRAGLLDALGATAIPEIELHDAGVLPDGSLVIPTGASLVVTSNGTALKHEPDYTRVLYFNAKAPLFGTATATLELAADGTLSKATGAVDGTKLAEQVPLKELLTMTFLPGIQAEAPPSSISVKARTQGYAFTLKKAHSPGATRRQQSLTFGAADSVVRAALGSAPKKPKAVPIANITASIVKPAK